MGPIITEKDCCAIIKHVYPHSFNTIDLIGYEAMPYSQKSAGFLGNHLTLKITIQPNSEEFNNGIRSEIRAFVKILPTLLEHRRYVEESSAFRKEYKFFNTLAPMLKKISEKLECIWAPDCYLTREDVLVFEDLSEVGFKTINDNQLMNIEHLRLAAESLGHFHSMSIILEEGRRSKNNRYVISDEFSDCIFESIYVEDPTNVRYHWFENGVKTIIKMVNLIDKYTAEEKQKITEHMPALLYAIKKAFRPSNTKMNVVCHGDLWVNNFLFKYDDAEIPIKCQLIDFQIVRYAPAALDLIAMLYLCADKETRTKYETEVIAVYENAFNSALLKAGIKPPEHDIVEETNFFRAAALVEACLYEMVTKLPSKAVTRSLSNSEDVQQFFYGDRTAIAVSNFKTDFPYRRRMSELIEEFVDKFVLV